MRGRKPHATEAKRLAGNPGRRPLNDAEPSPPAPASTFDEPPPELDNQPDASAEWRRLAPMLRQVRIVTMADRGALIALCLEWGRYLEATREIRKLGLIVKTPKTGYPIPNPYLPIATKALAGCNKLWPELGLTPSSRSRVSAAADGPPPEGDAFAEFDDTPTLTALQ